MSGVQLPFVSALLVLDNEGGRVAVKYWDQALLPSKGADDALRVQVAFEKKVFAKTVRQQRQDGFDSIPDVMILDSCVIVYKVINDTVMYIVGNSQENELILHAVLQALDETICNLLKNQVSKRTLVENLDLLLLSIDEIIDDGLVLETDPNMVVSRVCMVGGDKDVPLSEQSLTQALQTATDQFVRSFR